MPKIRTTAALKLAVVLGRRGPAHSPAVVAADAELFMACSSAFNLRGTIRTNEQLSDQRERRLAKADERDKAKIAEACARYGCAPHHENPLYGYRLRWPDGLDVHLWYL